MCCIVNSIIGIVGRNPRKTSFLLGIVEFGGGEADAEFVKSRKTRQSQHFELKIENVGCFTHLFSNSMYRWVIGEWGGAPCFRIGTQRFLTRSRKIKLLGPSEGIFRDPTKYLTTKKFCKIGPLGPKKKINFFSFFLMRKRLSSGQKWFLRP